MRAARIDQVDALLADGRITKQQADALKERIRSGEPAFGWGGPGMGHGFGFGFGFGRHGGHLFGGLDTAAGYLGLTEAELSQRLADGKSLADIAKAEGKSVDGLVDALVADVEKRLDAAVADGHLTEQQAKDMLERITKGVRAIVERSFDGPPPAPRAFGDKGWFGGQGGMGRAPGASAPLAPPSGAPA